MVQIWGFFSAVVPKKRGSIALELDTSAEDKADIGDSEVVIVYALVQGQQGSCCDECLQQVPAFGCHSPCLATKLVVAAGFPAL